MSTIYSKSARLGRNGMPIEVSIEVGFYDGDLDLARQDLDQAVISVDEAIQAQIDGLQPVVGADF